MMKYFYAIVHKDPDSAYGVTFPDLPGCFSAADREEEVLPNAVEALDLWFEDADDVQPRPIDQIRAAVADELAQGAYLLAVPRISAAGKITRVNLSMDRGMLDAIDDAAALRKLTRSAFMIEAARNEIEGRH
ncbi:type II toxin-antitoxin system HicB family antitoxin [Sphingobium sp. JS3065]|jgi:predicted RNase H-like HicB family nuclease|uniref:type II toxin-antitoxin system HicB family antitoxin n=1 Tax=Sphingobium sp. JS3065 TaxID=2970925 RepID=UPI0022648D77|nr:type II toxin-antitoxin system HicB family antitoxin [Sphingobium sp. JS3065]UZW55348.1 type II toxin-antitoxin system HicB family antitoxin [Sphingobium sp. JS3065]